MEKWPKEKLLSEVKYLQNKLRDLVTAYKSLLKEKQALDTGLKAINNVSDGENSETNQNEKDKESQSSSYVEDKKCSSKVSTLMNSLTSLSAEKSRMEATFQADKKKLRQEKDKCEMMVRELQDKLKSINLEHNKEVEQLKTNLIIERHEREKEQNDHQLQLRELQDLLKQEKDMKVYLEHTLSDLATREEVERFKEINIEEKFVSLQKKHMVALEQEKQKVHKETERAYEQRIASLENKLAELSTTLVKYNRNRQEDQHEILKLREQISELSLLTSNTTGISVDSESQTNLLDVLTDKNDFDINTNVKVIKEKLQYYEDMLVNANKYCEKSLNVSYEDYAVPSTSKATKEIVEKEINVHENRNELKNLQIKVQMLSDQNNLLSDQLNDTVVRYEKQIEELRKQHNLIASRYEKDIQDLHGSYKLQISDLEVQVQKQRERTLALLEEKEQEVSTLKSSFQLFVPGNKHAVMLPDISDESFVVSQLDEVLDNTPKLSVQENPHILYYAHELARRHVVITGLRKNCAQLENSLRDVKKESIMLKQCNQEHVNSLKNQISRLERCQSREGANLEYLKNVIVNYLHSKNAGSKRHMLNAIAVILKLTDTEINKIRNAL